MTLPESRPVGCLSAIVALLATGVLACDPNADRSTSHLRVLDSGPLTESFAPCTELNGLAATIRVSQDRLDQLTGTVRRTQEAPSGATLSTVYLVELSVQFVDGGGNVLWQEVESTQLSASAGSSLEASLVAAWDGVVKQPDALTLAPTGTLEMRGEVNLVRVEGMDRFIVTDEVLQTVSFSEDVEVMSPSAACQEWVAIGHTLGTGLDGTVRVHGQDSPMTPTIAWREGRPTRLLGEMGAAASATVAARSQAVRGFLDAHPTLFRIGAPAVTATLRPATENTDPDGVRRVVLEQSIEEQRTVGGVTQTVQIRAPAGKLNAAFDTGDELVYVSGRVLEDLPSSFLSAMTTVAQATTAVQQDLATKGMDTGRSITLREEIIHGEDATEYQRAYVIRVGTGDGAQFPSESAESRIQAFDYTVSAMDGSILDIRHRTSLNSILVDARVFEYDPSDPGPDGSVVAADAPVNMTSTCIAGPPHAQPALLPTRLVEIRIEDRESPSAPFFLREDEGAVNGVVEEVEISPTGDEFSLRRTRDFNVLLTNTTAAGQALRALTAYWQMQVFWQVVGQPLLEDGSWDRVKVHIDHSDTKRCAPGNHKGSDIKLHSNYTNSILYTPAHEIFHHFDEETAGLKREKGQPLGMPSVLKESMADFMMQFIARYNPNNTTATGARSLICIFSSDFNDCMTGGGGGAFRSDRIIPLMRHRPLRTSGVDTDLSPWPDCRITTNRSVHCLLIRVPGSSDPGTFAWDRNDLIPIVQIGLIAQTLQDAWETGATVEGGGHFAAAWPITVARGFTFLEDDASFVDFRDSVLFSTLLGSANGVWSQDMLGVITDAFQRHGLDASLEQFCAAGATEDSCH